MILKRLPTSLNMVNCMAHKSMTSSVGCCGISMDLESGLAGGSWAREKGYDLVVIGGGAAGFAAIVKYRELLGFEKRIAMITKGPIGGTCVNVGCVPSKHLIETAKAFKIREIFSRRGVKVSQVGIEFPSIMKSLREFVESIRRDKYEKLLEHYDVDLYIGTARFTSPKSISVSSGDGRIDIYGEHFIVATGSRPSTPRIDGLNEISYYTSDTIWGVEELPGRMLVMGSGAIGLELAQAFARLGSIVEVVEILDRPLPGVEPEISKALGDILSKEGVKIYTKSKVAGFSRRGSRVVAKILTPQGSVEEEYDAVLIATGRRPNTEDLGLELAGIEVDNKGFVRVSRDLRTSNPKIYAAGDVAGTPKPALLETLAAKEGATAAENIALGGEKSIDYEATPVVIFTDPEVAYVGFTEHRLVEAIGMCSCRVVGFNLTAKSGIMGVEQGLAKIVVDPRSNVIVGVHVLAPHASEFIVAASLMIKHRYTVEDLVEAIHVFPTAYEVMKLAGQAFIRDVGRMPCCVE